MEQLLQKRENTLTVYIPEEVDHCFSDKVREEVDKRLQTEDIHTLVFDFEKTEFMDSSGIGMILGRYKLLNSLGGYVYINNPTKSIMKIIEVSGISRIIPVVHPHNMAEVENSGE